jgi:hypothetical protein
MNLRYTALETRMLTFYITDEPTIYRFRDKNANHYDHIVGFCLPIFVVVMVSVLVLKAVDCGFIGAG